MTKHRLGIAVVFALAGTVSQDLIQSAAPPARPKFEVASVKECKGADPAPPSVSSPGRLSLGCWNLMTVILQACEVFASGKLDPLNPMPSTPVEGAPAWVRSARYAIDAKADGRQSAAMMRGPMMQALLEERFHMRTHREIREVPVYVMTVAKGGPKFRPSKEGSCQPYAGGDLNVHLDGMPCAEPQTSRKGPIMAIDFRGVSLDAFAKDLHPDGRRVIDRTGLAGAFDIHLELEDNAPDSPGPGSGAASDPSPHSSFIVALREQLGLQLAPGKGSGEFLVIDHIERPSGN
ncbi:MAG: TIGR03435 family protein [Candidatus Sulfopaludibacter sp.]|nr:TIGR03435 family protein [Candidatus Sulfopaludibacter sp.]